MTSDENFIPTAIAVTANGSFEEAVSAEHANTIFSEMIRNTALDCVKAGSQMIGHIKANVRSGPELLSMSSTTDDGNVRMRSVFTGKVKDHSMTVNVIVYGVDRHTVADISVRNIKKAVGNISITVHSEIGCEDPECTDPMCQDAGHRRIIRIG